MRGTDFHIRRATLRLRSNLRKLKIRVPSEMFHVDWGAGADAKSTWTSTFTYYFQSLGPTSEGNNQMNLT